jgi:phosphoribosylglycinamide formyltransferase-1
VSLRVGVLASGAGTNLQALIDRVHGRDGVAIVAVGSDAPRARALDRAREAGIATAVFERAGFVDRGDRDRAMAEWLLGAGTELVVLAGYMQLVSPAFLEAFPDRVINVHPALLPAFRGLAAVEQALDHGVKVFGVTVHFVDEGVDTGRIIAQRAVELPDAREPDEVRGALRPVEHDLLCGAVQAFARGAVSFDRDHPRRVVVAGRDMVPRP